MSKKSIPTYKVNLDPSDWKELHKNDYSSELYDAILKVGNNEYQMDFGFRGNHIRKVAKKSYEFIFPQVTAGMKQLHVNAEYYDRSMIRNKLSFDFFSDIGVLVPHCDHIRLMINGEYEGVYLQIESVDRYFLKKRNLPKGAIFYAENDNANFSLMSPIWNDKKRRLDAGYSRKEGNSEDQESLQNLIYQINTLEDHRFETEIQKYVDVDKYLRWLAGVVCTQNYDGFIHNYALYQRSDNQLFEMIPWDYDATWGRDIHGDIMEYDYTPIQGYNTLTGRLLDVSAFREHYHDLMAGLLDKEFTPEYQVKKIDALYEKIAPYVDNDPYMKDSLDQFYEEPFVILEYIEDRNQYLRKHLKDLRS